jgi:hypothetical protein
MKVDGDHGSIRAAWATDPGPELQILIGGCWVDAQDGARFRCFDPYAEQEWG